MAYAGQAIPEHIKGDKAMSLEIPKLVRERLEMLARN